MIVGYGKRSVSWNLLKVMAIAHFRVASSLCFKARLSAEPLIWKWFSILMQIKLIFTIKVLHLASFWKWVFGTRKWPINRHAFCIGNSMIFSDIWRKYHQLYFEIVIHNLGEWNLRQFWNITSGISAKYHVQIMLLLNKFCLYYYRQKFCNFHM